MNFKLEEEKKLLGPYHLVLGLEIHMHVKTDRKMFCGCSTDGIYSVEPNTRTCPVCLGMPGALPVPNRDAIEKTHRLGIALNCRINEHSNFDRKHYFYPDLPKGYQISQYKNPLCSEGFLKLSSGTKIEIERVHLEEDTAKSFHEGSETLIDFNKSGIALIELVTKPTIYSVTDAVEFCRKVQEIVRYLGVSDANMEKGQLRIEPNISLRTQEMFEEGKLPEYKVEVKNINSFKFMEKAVISEIKRQRKILEKGEALRQENRGYNEKTGKTVLQRSKEEAEDYRYFPEPDIPPMVFNKDYLAKLGSSKVRLPEEVKKSLRDKYDLSDQEVSVLFSKNLVGLLEEAVGLGGDVKRLVNLLVNDASIRDVSAQELIRLIRERSVKIDNVPKLEEIVIGVMNDNRAVVKQIRDGKESAIEFLVGQVMRMIQGKADPNLIRELINKSI